MAPDEITNKPHAGSRGYSLNGSLWKRSRSAAATGYLLAALGACVAWAGGGPENVAVVVNADSWASMTLANEFVHLRGIPTGNIVYLEDLPSFEYSDVETFRQRILLPVLDAIRRRGLTEQIDYVVYSCDLPYAIDLSKEFAGRPVPQVITPTASSNGLTYLYRDVLAKDLGYVRLDVNRYMRRTLPLQVNPPYTEAEQRQIVAAEGLYNQKKWQEAAAGFDAVARDHPADANALYNLSCCLARAGNANEAMLALHKATAAGWRDHQHTLNDEDLTSLRERADFRELLEQLRTAVVEVQPTRGFRGSYNWNEKGELVDTGGKQYLLSSVLGVTSGRGNSVREVLECLRRSAAADGTRPAGTIYFMRNGDVRSTTREWAFDSAAAQLRALGVAAENQAGVVPSERPDVAGAIVGVADFDWARSHSVILPGAVCEHLTSTGGVIDEYGGQTPCTEFIRRGAAGSSGTVTEPFALQDKFPSAFLHVHYARGCSLAEAFYQSVYGPYQLLILGDALCQPWAKRPEVTLAGLADGTTVRGKIELRPAVKNEAPTAIARFEMFVDGIRKATLSPDKAGALDTAALADGYHELTMVAIRADAIETQGRVVVPFSVDNQGRKIAVTPLDPENAVWGKRLTLHAQSDGARQITIYHNGRALAVISGPEGRVEINTRQLGIGPVRLYAIATADGDRPLEVRSPPVQFSVQPPPSIRPLAPPSESQFEKGLRLTSGKQKPAAVDDTRADDWLSKAGFEAGQDFELTGYFDAPQDDWYQIQVRSNVGATIEIGNTRLDVPTRNGWVYAPAALERGTHLLRIRGHAPRNPRLDVRLGAAGTYRLGGGRFRHVVP